MRFTTAAATPKAMSDIPETQTNITTGKKGKTIIVKHTYYGKRIIGRGCLVYRRGKKDETKKRKKKRQIFEAMYHKNK